ncbi:GNAT family N-acetyltransferase [Corynebacterium sphenisci]|uniref:GNAT family N-acetyltransferase n=1 Tax=Corynebacterium sphenisci TaxID=191493 RepID=UPI0026DEA40C|nr:GNAT family N-acetyltransferase [Corynebacterium sphenisci]MDO5732011.1 GNAT family N-acetyltransferase [Corynebacterium sphenisci]
MTEIRHEPAAARYVLDVDGAEAGFAAYADDGAGVLDFHHTVVHPGFRGRGLSAPLVRGALDDVRARGLRIRPSCSAVAHFLDKNPAYADLVA